MSKPLKERVRSSGQRLLAVMRKEIIQRFRDKRTLLLILSVPLIELFLFAYAVDLTADHLPTVVADLSLDAESYAFVDALEVSGYFDIIDYLASEEDILDTVAARYRANRLHFFRDYLVVDKLA